MYPPNLKSVALSFPQGVAKLQTPDLEEGEAVGCRDGRPTVRKSVGRPNLVSFYRPSIVTFPLSLRVSEIVPLVFSRTPLSPYLTSSLPKISPCSSGIR